MFQVKWDILQTLCVVCIDGVIATKSVISFQYSVVSARKVILLLLAWGWSNFPSRSLDTEVYRSFFCIIRWKYFWRPFLLNEKDDDDYLSPSVYYTDNFHIIDSSSVVLYLVVTKLPSSQRAAFFAHDLSSWDKPSTTLLI